MGTVRRVLCAPLVTDFLEYVLHHDSEATLLIVCSTRDSFLEKLLASVHAESINAPDCHRLLTKTIGSLSKSTKVTIAFCPTLEHLRACLSGPIRQSTPEASSQQILPSLMAILDPLSLHLSTLEFSAQGLSRTLALAVEASSKESMDIVLCESKDPLDLTGSECGEALWYVEVPLLSNHVRRGAGADGSSGRSVPVKRVAQRWFEFTELGPLIGTMGLEKES